MANHWHDALKSLALPLARATFADEDSDVPFDEVLLDALAVSIQTLIDARVLFVAPVLADTEERH